METKQELEQNVTTNDLINMCELIIQLAKREDAKTNAKNILAEKVYEGCQDLFKLACPNCGNVQKSPLDFRAFTEDLTLEDEDKLSCPKCNKDLGVKLKYSVYTSC
ncbi:MAG: hypothetical protein ACLFP2_00255 [Candidatus Woesearchaeota archaeon]